MSLGAPQNKRLLFVVAAMSFGHKDCGVNCTNLHFFCTLMLELESQIDTCSTCNGQTDIIFFAYILRWIHFFKDSYAYKCRSMYLWLKWWNVMFKDCLLWSIMDHPVKISPVRRQWERLGDDKFVQIVRLSGIVPRSDQIPHKCWKYFVFFWKWNVIIRIVKSSG